MHQFDDDEDESAEEDEDQEEGGDQSEGALQEGEEEDDTHLPEELQVTLEESRAYVAQAEKQRAD